MAKRKARRTTERIKEEYRKNYGESMEITIRRLRDKLGNRDKRVAVLLGKIKEMGDDKNRAVREVSKLKNREIRKRDTIIRNLKKKAEEKKKREGRGFKRSIVYKNRWREFEPSPSLLRLKESIDKASKTSKSRKEIFEILQKTSYYVDKFNRENDSELTLESVIALITFYLIDDVRGIMNTRHRLYGHSLHKTRKVVNSLLKSGLIVKNSVWYNTNLMADVFIKGLENHLLKGRSEVIKLLEGDGD